jgi:glycosyltransferase involved in cell wall biosynthesis
MINFQTPINNLGYGVAGYNIFKEIINIHPSAALYPISTPEFTDEYIEKGLSNRYNFDIPARERDIVFRLESLKYHKVLSDQTRREYYEELSEISGEHASRCGLNFPSVKMWHQNDVHTHIGKGEHIGFPIFELTEFSKEEKLSMAHCDRLFVCSQWAKNVLIENNVKKPEDIHVVPLGVDTEIFKPAPKRIEDKTIFFNCGKWEVRKGHDVLIECFNAAFEPRDNVELWMMCDNPFIGQMNDQWKNLYKNSKLGHKIKFIPRQETHEDVYNIMRRVDCGVFPARAEGWNLELLEMMACGKQVIATNYSAHTEFCNDSNSYPIEMSEREKAYDGVFFDGSKGEWASFNNAAKDQLIEHMRMVHGVKEQYTNGWDTQMREFSSTNHAGIKTANKFTWENSAKELLKWT